MSDAIRIPYNKPHIVGRELSYIRKAYSSHRLSGDGYYTKKCQDWLNTTLQCRMSLLTHSGTAGLEMMAILSNIKPGEEVIMPSYTFVSTANAFVLRGAIPVFIDIRPDTLNINEKLIEKAITKKTKAIVPVHYAGVSCEMDEIMSIAKAYKLLVLEDAAQGIMATYKGRHLGSIGDMAALSFHETKNVISGEGGAILINKLKYYEQAKIVWEKGTNRSKFFLGLVDKYTWVNIGSSYLPSEITASFLMAQLENASLITKKRVALWNIYHRNLEVLEKRELLRRPIIPKETIHNGHIYYVLTRNSKERNGLSNFLKERGILAVTHYVPLHSSPAGKKFSRFVGNMKITDYTADTLLRLPLFYDLKQSEQFYVLQSIHDYYKRI